MSDVEPMSFEAEVPPAVAEGEIAKAVSARHSIARKHVLRLRRKHPEATPAQLVTMLERQYVSAITTAGAIIAAGAIAADVGIAMIPVAGAAAAGAKSASQQAAKKAGKEVAKATTKAAMKQGAKGVGLAAAKGGAQRVAAMLPAGDEQLQFEITAIFALAIADIHDMDLDREQAQALVFGLSNERVSQQQIAAMAADVSSVAAGGELISQGAVGTGRSIAAGRGDWSHWASTLADGLPGGAAQSLVRTMQSGQLEDVRTTLSGKQQAAIEYGAGAISGGVARFAFGKEVVLASRLAFPAAPDEFPSQLAVPAKDVAGEPEPNRALAAFEEAAKGTGGWIATSAGTVGGGIASGANAVGTGISSAAGTVSRPFRRVDLDGDGVPDEARALAAAKGVGGAFAGAAGAVGGGVSALFKGKKGAKDSKSTGDDA